MDISADAYMKEPVLYPALHVVDLEAEGAKVTDAYRNMVISRVNGSCLRLAVFDGDYRWHYHPQSDELFVVIEGCLAIDLEGGSLAHSRFHVLLGFHLEMKPHLFIKLAVKLLSP